MTHRSAAASARRVRGTIALGAVAALALTACSPDAPSSGGDSDGAPQNVELNMWLFGDFGYDPLIEEYEAANPGVTINTQIADFAAHHDALTTALAAGSPPDIAAVEVSYMAAYKDQAQNFHNLLDYGAGDLEGDYLDWKWSQATTGDGSAVIGLPTDVGPMVMCYRHDLFAEAGLPADRDEVSALWATWDDFIEVGKSYTAATGKGFTNDANLVFSAVVNQGEKKYYELDGTTIYEENPQVRKAWDIAMAILEEGISANISSWSAEWNAGMNNGDFAVLTCPAWMLPYIEGQAPDTAGNWDVAAMPEGGGNWGGSFLTLPAGSPNQQAAYDFISWLLAPEQQLKVFEATGNFPSTPELYETDAVANFSSEFFNNAPLGQIFAESALSTVAPFEGAQDGAIQIEFDNGIGRVSQGEETPDQAWASTIEAIKREVRD